MDETSERILGTLRSQDGTAVVRMEDRFDTDAADLWSALTEPRRLARWIAEVSGDLRPGGMFQARFTSEWEGTGRIDVCEPPRRLVVSTRQAGTTRDVVIEATLAADGASTVLVIETRGMPIEQIAGYGAGWQVHVEDLGAYLTGRERCDIMTRWDALEPLYADLAAESSRARR